jgi:hypothetical protein
MHAQNFTYHLLPLLLLRLCFCTIYFIDTHHTILSDSLRIVLHYYIQYEVRFSLSYLKKEIYLTINIQIFPFLLFLFAVVYIVCICLITCRICMVSLLEQCHESSHPRWPLIGTNQIFNISVIPLHSQQTCVYKRK